MIKAIIAAALATAMMGAETPADWAADLQWYSMTEEQRYEASVEIKARAVGLTEEEFRFFSACVEAESDRGTSEDSQEGRVLIALTVYNRVESDSFPDTVEGVLRQNGQFSVVSNGQAASVGRTNMSDWAIIEAHRRLAGGDAPHVMYFNCIGYNGFEAYGIYGDNYFMTTPQEEQDE